MHNFTFIICFLFFYYLYFTNIKDITVLAYSTVTSLHDKMFYPDVVGGVSVNSWCRPRFNIWGLTVRPRSTLYLKPKTVNLNLRKASTTFDIKTGSA